MVIVDDSRCSMLQSVVCPPSSLHFKIEEPAYPSSQPSIDRNDIAIAPMFALNSSPSSHSHTVSSYELHPRL